VKTGTGEALALSVAMAAVIFFCRIFPFLFFRGKAAEGGLQDGRPSALLAFVEKTVPPAAMTALAFNSLAAPIKANPGEAVPVFAAAVFTALVHLWRKNPLVSIFGGTALYMLLTRLL